MMTEPRPARTASGHTRTFGPDESALDVENSSVQHHDTTSSTDHHRPSGRVSFSHAAPRPSMLRWRGTIDEDEFPSDGVPQDKPSIPSALQGPREEYATPLPILSMIVLSITLLGEFLSANVSAPFLLFMVEGFGQLTEETDVGYWTGILVSTFFLTQFLTSLLWATIAAKHGSRIVICIALFGSAVTLLLFGTSTSLQQAIAIRLMQGIFAGAIGVARGCVAGITDQSNEGRAYAILGFCWGFGGVAGAIVGGTFESPAKKWPVFFSKFPIFITYPYLLPCAVAASITLTGSFLCLFLGPDCGPREGAIRLLEKAPGSTEDPTTPSTPVTPFEEVPPQPQGILPTLREKVARTFSFSRRVSDVSEHIESPLQSVPMSTTPRASSRPRAFSRTSRADGSAYGYNGAYRNRLSSVATRRGSMAVSLRRRRDSNRDGDVPQSSVGTDLNFAQRLLMANENAVTNIADLWVAAAINADNEDPFESEDDIEDGEEDVEEFETFRDNDLLEPDIFGSGTQATASTPSQHSNRFSRSDSSAPLTLRGLSKRPSSGLGLSPRRPSSSHRQSFNRHASVGSVEEGNAPHMHRRPSSSIPTIFAHTGVRTPPAVLEAQLQQFSDEPSEGDALAPIMEGQQVPPQEEQGVEGLEREPSLFSLLPVLVIVQYGLLALHSTTHDQVFYLYLVSKYPSGGLNLNAGHFSQLIALMCLAQIAYQFYLYPNIGPPRGRFSHLSMFRIGSLLFIPSYLSVILYRVFASPTNEGNLLLMAALAVSTAVRFCGQTFSYTAISVLLNYMSPPHLVGYANGIAQSIVSLARFIGPILGGTLWSVSVNDNPGGYPLGFIACACVCGLAIAHSFFIR